MAIVVAEQTSPSQTQTGQTVILTRPILNFQHFTTPHGALMLVQFIVGIVIFVIGPPIWLNIVSWLAWIVTHLLIWLYLFSLNERYVSNPPVKVMEFYFNAGTAVLYALSVLFCFISLSWLSGIFGILNTVAYGAGAFFLIGEWKEYRQGTLPK